MIFKISCWILEKKKKKSYNFQFVKTVIFGNFRFGAKNKPKLQKLFIKRPKPSNCLIIFHIPLKKNPFFSDL